MGGFETSGSIPIKKRQNCNSITFILAEKNSFPEICNRFFYMSVVQCENYFLFLSCRASGRHIESVFALSSSENVEVFDNNGTTNSTHFLLAYGKAYFCASILHIYQVWGIVSFIVVIGLSTTI